LSPQDIFKLVEKGLARTEQELVRQSSSNIQLIDRIGQYIHNSGGKRIRPAILLLSSQVCGYDGPAGYRLSAVVEMIHAATLVHDDIIDDAEVRRGQASVNAQWGSEITVLMGDWLYMTSFTIALAERQFKILDILIEVARKMVEGELIQLGMNGSTDITEEQLLDVSMRKTAYLFAACSQLGGVLGGVTEEKQELLRLYGLNVGIAFQVVDDLLDLTSNESKLGKPVGSDLKEGKMTLPLIYLMQDGDSRCRDLVRKAMRENGFRTVPREVILDLVREFRTAERVMSRVQEYTRSAKSFLSHFEPGKAREALMAIPDYIVERDR
jgi:octaprenyl-diphosphate synthase